MPLADRLAQPDSSYPRTPCSIGALIKELPPSESKALTKMLDAPWRLWSHAGIEAALREEGHSFGDQMVGKHRRKQCSCFRSGRSAT